MKCMVNFPPDCVAFTLVMVNTELRMKGPRLSMRGMLRARRLVGRILLERVEVEADMILRDLDDLEVTPQINKILVTKSNRSV
jgi:hypothetical protein